MELRFLGKDSSPQESPTLYSTDRESYIVQGWIVTDVDILAGLDLTDEETIVEVPARLLTFLAEDGVEGAVGNLVVPIMHVKDNGNYLVKGRRVSDPTALDIMRIPDHETCVEVAKAAMLALLAGR